MTAPYCKPMVEADDGAVWPNAGRLLLNELTASGGRHGLIVGEPSAADRLVARLAADLNVAVLRLGAALADRDHPPTSADLEAVCGAATILTDVDILLWRRFGVPVLPFLAALARRQPTIAVWPGEIAGGRARYSAPGRPDHHDERLVNVVVLRPRTTRFPDEVPYHLERVTP